MPMHSLPVVNFKMTFKSGSALDPIGKKGCSLLTAELLNKGVRGKSAIDFLEKVEHLGGTLQANATQDLSIITGSFLKSRIKDGFTLLSEMVQYPNFNESEFSKSQHRLISSIQGIKDNPEALSSVYYQNLFFNDQHPYSLPVHGLQHTVSEIKTADIEEYYHSNYHPKNAVLSIVGDFETNSMLEMVKFQFENWEASSLSTIPSPELVIDNGVNIYIIDKPDVVQTQIKIGSQGIFNGHKSYFPLTVANTIFGGSFTSRLVQSVRVEQGLTYSINSGFTILKHEGPFTISTFTKNETVGKTLGVILKEINHIKENGIHQDELDKAKSYLTGTYPLSIETFGSLAIQLTNIACYDLPKTWVSDYIPNIQSLTIDNINSAINDYFPDNKLVIVLITNVKSVINQLQGLGTVKIVDEKII